MFGHRTPIKKVPETNRPAPQMADRLPTTKAGPSYTHDTVTSKVRRSIGEWEAGKRKASLPAPTASGSTDVLLPSPPSNNTSSEVTEKTARYSSRLAEAKASLMSAKKLLSSSRNLKTEIKTDVNYAIERLYALVKEAEEERRRAEKKEESVKKNEQEPQEKNKAKNPVEPEKKKTEELIKNNTEEQEKKNIEQRTIVKTAAIMDPEQVALMRALVEGMEEHGRRMSECNEHMRTLADRLRSCPLPGSASELPASYAMVAARGKPVPQIHSMVITGNGETSGELVDKIRHAVDAKVTGIQVDRLRKAKDQKVVMGFGSKEELGKASKRIKEAGSLRVEEIQNKDPLVVLMDVMTYITDEDVVTAMRNQNRKVFEGVSAEDQRLQVRYRRKTRNPLQNHVVLQVSPQLWRRLTVTGRVYVDVQYVRVADQTPLVQCSLCLAYGHGRRFCTQTQNTCSHCEGPHPWAECKDRLAGTTPSCCNCTKEKHNKKDHNAFSKECAVRMKWDALARATTAYC